MGTKSTQFTLWGTKGDPPSRFSHPIEMDPFYLWKIAIRKYDFERWEKGWRPWHKKGE